jgi:hypothetical protein
VRVERVEGTEPVKRLLSRDREDNFVSDPSEDGTGPTRELERRESSVIFDKPPISKGREPFKLFESKVSEITSPAPEQVRPGHTGERHFKATVEQFQAGI